MTEQQILFTPRDTAAYLKLTERFLQYDRCNRQTIPFIKINRLVRYRKADLDAFLEKSKKGGEA